MRLGTHCALVISLSLGLSASFAAAEEPEAAEEKEYSTARTMTDPRSPVEHVELTLRDAVELALRNNLDVMIERHGPLLAQEDLALAWSAYDPTLSGSYTFSNIRQQNTFALNEGATNKTTSRNGALGLSGLVPWLGATLSVNYAGSRVKTDQGSVTFSPEYESGLSFSANVPLLRGLVWNEPWTNVRIAGLSASIADEEFRGAVINTVHGTVAAYWNLVADREKLRVAIKSLETSRALLEQTRTQYEVGVKSKVEVVQAEAGVAAREFDHINAEAVYRNSQDGLVDILHGRRLTAISNIDLEPVDDPFDFQEYEVDPVIATEYAMKNRPELAQVRLVLEQQEVDLRFRKNLRLPELDFNAAYGTSAIEGKGNPDLNPLFGTPESTGGGFNDTHDDWFEKRSGRDYSVGASISIPIGNYGPRHNVTKARIQLREAKTRLAQIEQLIVFEVRTFIRLLQAAREGIDAAERQRVAAEEQLRAERIRLEHGESTPFDVLEKESELVDAEVKKIAALQTYRTAASDLDRAQATILRNHNVVIGSVAKELSELERESFAPRDLVDPLLP